MLRCPQTACSHAMQPSVAYLGQKVFVQPPEVGLETHGFCAAALEKPMHRFGLSPPVSQARVLAKPSLHVVGRALVNALYQC